VLTPIGAGFRAREATLGIARQVGAVDPVVHGPVEVGIGRTDLRERQECREGVLVGLHPGLQALDLLVDQGRDALAAQELREAAERALIALEPRAEARVRFVGQSRVQVFPYRSRNVPLLLAQDAGLEREEVRLRDAPSALLEDTECVLHLVVVPKERGQLEDAPRASRLALQDMVPDRPRSLEMAAFDLHLPELGEERVGIFEGGSGPGHDRRGQGTVARLERREGPVQGKHSTSQRSVAGVGRGESVGGRGGLLEAREPRPPFEQEELVDRGPGRRRLHRE
jgi:hypothetical protein